MMSVKEKFIDRLVLIATAISVTLVAMALLYFMQNTLGLEARWYLFLMHAFSVFGLLVYVIRYELRLARKQLWRKLPLVVGFGVLALFHGVVLGSVVYVYGPEWRMWEYTFLAIMEIALFYAALYPIYEYCTLPNPPAFMAFLKAHFKRRRRENM